MKPPLPTTTATAVRSVIIKKYRLTQASTASNSATAAHLA